MALKFCDWSSYFEDRLPLELQNRDAVLIYIRFPFRSELREEAFTIIQDKALKGRELRVRMADSIEGMN